MEKHKKTKKIIFLFIIFIIIFFFGERIQMDGNLSRRNDPFIGLDSNQYGKYPIERIENGFMIRNFFTINKDECYRVLFTGSIKDSIHKPVPFKMFISNSISEQEVGSFAMNVLPGEQSFEQAFCASSQYTDLQIIVLGDLNDSIRIDNKLILTRLLVKSTASLDKSVFNSFRDGPVIEKDLLSGKRSKFKFKRADMLATASFCSTSTTNLVGIRLGAHFAGNGGYGEYDISFLEKEDENVFKFLNKFSFNAYTAESLYKIEKNIYQLPISSKLIEGKCYVIHIDNRNVETSVLHNLQLFGNDGKNNFTFELEERAAIEKSIEPISAYYQDIGENNGLLGYESTGESSDLVDVFFSQNSVRFDQLKRALVAPVDGEVIYKFRSPDPINTVNIVFKELTGEYYGTEVEYSFDNQNWTDLALGTNNEMAKVGIIDGNLNRELFIKIKGNRLIGNFKSNNEFGISYLKLSAFTIKDDK